MMKWIHLILYALCVTYAVFSETSDYNTNQKFEFTAIDKIQSQGKHSANFYIVGKMNKDYVFEYGYSIPKDYVFDYSASPATYSQVQIGKSYNIETRPFDVRQDKTLNFFFVILGVISYTFTIVFGAILAFQWINRLIKHIKKKREVKEGLFKLKLLNPYPVFEVDPDRSQLAMGYMWYNKTEAKLKCFDGTDIKIVGV